MKFLPPLTSSASGGALNKRNVYLCILCLVIVALWDTHSVTATPAKLDSLDSTFPLDFQPPVFEARATVSASPSAQRNGKSVATTSTVDSYGNLIASLQPIDTPDGRKVVSAQGLQFEIPNYASGITELKKPADDLLPPFIDPIVVALPDSSSESFSTNPGPTSSDETTGVDVETVPIVEIKLQPSVTHSALASLSKGLPDYILELNDPDIGGAVTYKPSEDNRRLNVIAWDLVPPLEGDEAAGKSISHSNKVSVTSGGNLNGQASLESSQSTQKPQLSTTRPNLTQYRGGVSYTNPTSTTTTTTATSTTTSTTPRTTSRRTSTPRTTTTTTRRSTTHSSTTLRSTTTPRVITTTPEPHSSEFFKLEAGDSYTLPPWLQDIDDPELDVAVTFEIPEDINEYNHTVATDLVPPLEPYTDLININISPPPNLKDITTTTERAITTSDAATPTNPTTVKQHWVRARPTLSKPSIATFNNPFTSLSSPSLTTNFAQRTTSTTTTTVKPKSATNFHNRQLSSNTPPQTDKIADSVGDGNTNSKNPFLPAFDDGKYKQHITSGRTTTSTTTTTPAPEIIEKNPFEATIPPWLKDFDYPDVGPGVPFIYDPNDDENPVGENILPPSKYNDTNAKTNPSSTFSFLNSQMPQAFTNKFTSSAFPLTSSIPSIVTIPPPSTQKKQDDSTFTEASFEFVSPTTISPEGNINEDKSNDFSKKSSSTFNKNFAAPFESSIAATGGDQKKVPLSADRESFPPFNTITTASSTVPSKTTFRKSEDGKVLTKNIFLSGGLLPTSAKPIGSSQVENNQIKDTLISHSPVGSSFTTSSSASGFVTSSSASSSSSAFSSGFAIDAPKYNGPFGGSPGVLAPQINRFSASTATVTQSYNKPAVTTFGVTSTPVRPTNNNYKFTGSFGGPPGILKPYDNVRNH